MPTWVIIAALATIGITGLLAGLLQRINSAALERWRADQAGAGANTASMGHEVDGSQPKR